MIQKTLHSLVSNCCSSSQVSRSESRREGGYQCHCAADVESLLHSVPRTTIQNFISCS